MKKNNEQNQFYNLNYEFSNKKVISIISIIFLSSLIIRFFYFDPNIPLTVDSLNYFFYAMDIRISQEIPINYSLANNGWPLFVSMFFSSFQFDDISNYMQLQKILSIIISSLTVIPVYFLCRKFFNPVFSLLGAFIIGFEPHLIQNSLFGISDSLYIFLVASTLAIFLNSKNKISYLSFGLVAISTIVRSEGIFLFFTLSLMYFIIHRKNKHELLKYFIPLSIFILILSPVMIYQNSIHGDDQMFGRAANSLVTHTIDPNDSGHVSGIPFILQGFENFPKYLGWNMLPIWIFFVPLGIIIILRRICVKTGLLISSIIIMSLPAFYAYSIPLQDGRYFFFLYPAFSVIALFSISKFIGYFPIKKEFVGITLIVGGIIFLSVFYLNNAIDNEHEKESFFIAKILVTDEKTVNSYMPESRYLEVAGINFNYAEFQKEFLSDRIPGKSIRHSIQHNVTSIHINNFNSIESLNNLKIENNLSHLVIDISKNENGLLNQIYHNENKFPMLNKIFDSNDYQMSYKIKIFEIK